MFAYLEHIEIIADSESQPPPPPLPQMETYPGAGAPLADFIAEPWQMTLRGTLRWTYKTIPTTRLWRMKSTNISSVGSRSRVWRCTMTKYWKKKTPLHQQNIFYSLEDSRSVWEDVECKLRSVNFRRVSDPWRVFRPAFRVTGICDDSYRSNWDLWWRVHEYDWSDFDKFGSTSESRRGLWVHLGVSPQITNKLWEMPGILWMFSRRTAGVIWDSADVHEQWTSLNIEYDAWIIVHHHFWIILAVISFNIVHCASLH